MHVLLDGTPLLGQPTGVGRYTRGLLDGLLALPDPPRLSVLAVSSAGSAPLREIVTVTAVGRRIPARALHAGWLHGAYPPVELLGVRDADVVHGTNFVLPPSRRAAGALSIHDLSVAHGNGGLAPGTGSHDRLVRAALGRGALALTLTDTLAGQVAEHYGLAAERVMAVRPGVDPAWSQAAPLEPDVLRRMGLPADYLLFVGSVEPRKNLPVLLAALRQLEAEKIDTPPLILAGPAGWGAALDVSGLKPGAVFRAGYVTDATLQQLVAGARALLLPSTHEGFGLTALEALAAGTPVVCSDLAVLREVQGNLGTYVSTGDIEAWAAVLADLDRTVPTSGRAARRAWADHWTWQRCATEAMLAYARAVER